MRYVLDCAKSNDQSSVKAPRFGCLCSFIKEHVKISQQILKVNNCTKCLKGYDLSQDYARSLLWLLWLNSFNVHYNINNLSPSFDFNEHIILFSPILHFCQAKAWWKVCTISLWDVLDCAKTNDQVKKHVVALQLYIPLCLFN